MEACRKIFIEPNGILSNFTNEIIVPERDLKNSAGLKTDEIIFKKPIRARVEHLMKICDCNHVVILIYINQYNQCH